MRPALILVALLGLAPAARACDTALVLAIDISGSIDAGEYTTQSQGLADALTDPDVTDALLRGQVALSVIHWSGVGRQAVTQPWQRMLSAGHVTRFAAAARAQPRAFRASDTAVGEALTFAIAQFDAVPDCARRVIDISGDGPENAGFTMSRARQSAALEGIEVNAIAIEDMGASIPITSYYQRHVVTRGGFVITSRGLAGYPAAMRAKLLRELTKPST